MKQLTKEAKGSRLVRNQNESEGAQVTGRKMTEQQIPQSEARPKALTLINHSFTLVDPDLNILAFNRSTANEVFELTGKTLLEDTPILDYITVEKKEQIKETLLKVLMGETLQDEPYYAGSDKNINWPAVIYSPVLDIKGNITGISINGDTVADPLSIPGSDLSNELYNYLSKATFDVIWDWNLTNNTLVYGDGFEVLFGYKKEEQITDISFRNGQIHPEDKDRVTLGLYRSIHGTQNIWTDTYRYQRSNGEYALVIDRGIIIRNEKGEAFRIIGAMKDITDIKESKILIRRNEKKLTTILESFTNGFVTIDRNCFVSYWNKEAEKMLGLDREKALGQPLKELFIAASDEKFYDLFSNALNKKRTFHFEEFFPFNNIWLEGSAYPSNEGWSIFFRDISKRKEYEENLNRERNLLRILIDNIPDYIYVKDTNLNYVINNKTIVNLNGSLSEEAILNKTGFEYFDTALAEKYLEDERYVLQTGLPIINKEEVVISPEGDQRWMLTTKMPLKDDKENILGIVGISRDITDGKRSEILLKELNASLEQRAAELVVSNSDLERFAYVASHDLQEPLRMISSFLQLLKKKYQGELDAKAEQYIYFAVDGAERMKKLIMDLLEYSRIGSNNEGFTLTNLNRVCEEVEALFEDIVDKSGASIQIGELPVIKTNKTQIVQLFQNLLSNALKYRSVLNPEISIQAVEQPDHWLFSVQDNGLGIEPRYFDKIFIIFQRLHSKSDFSGTGIGLAICKKIVERHGGTIWVESTLGHGSTFYFTVSKYL